MPYAKESSRRRPTKFRIYDVWEEQGFVSISTLTKRLNIKATQIKHWADLDLLVEAPESVERRKRLGGNTMRFYNRLEAIKITYMATMVNDAGLHPKVAAKFADLLKTKQKPDNENGVHWLSVGPVYIGVPHLGGLDEVRLRPSRRIGQNVAGKQNQGIRRAG